MRFRFKTSYDQDIELFEDRRHAFWYALLVAAAAAAPVLMDEYYLGELTLVLIWAIAGMGVMLLAGHTGQVSLGHAAFLACGAYSCVILESRAGVPFALAFPLSGLFAGVVGAVIAVPALRMSGIYLAIATLAMSIIAEDVIILLEPWTGGVVGLFPDAITVLGLDFDRYGSPGRFYWLCLGVAVLVTLGYANVLRSPTGRAFTAIRDSEVSARAMGVNVAVYKTLAFGLSCFVTGLAGALLAHYLGAFNHETFLVTTSITLVLMVVVGGLGSIHGAYFGAILIGLLPQVINIVRDYLQARIGFEVAPGIETGIFAVIVVALVIVEPLGIYGRWLKIRVFFELFPLYRKDMFRRQKSYLKTERMR